jgi:hypothetical protein
MRGTLKKTQWFANYLTLFDKAGATITNDIDDKRFHPMITGTRERLARQTKLQKKRKNNLFVLFLLMSNLARRQ